MSAKSSQSVVITAFCLYTQSVIMLTKRCSASKVCNFFSLTSITTSRNLRSYKHGNVCDAMSSSKNVPFASVK